ncbi:hypothetical protein GCM10027174_43650 [Salinifilum aidingensis]
MSALPRRTPQAHLHPLLRRERGVVTPAQPTRPQDQQLERLQQGLRELPEHRSHPR